MLTHGVDGKHKAKVHRIVRGAGYSIKRSSGGSAYSEAHEDVKQDKRLVQEAVNQHESHDHPGTKHTKLKLKSGGIAAGEKSHARLDKAKRGGKNSGKPHTKINILVAPGHSGSAAPAIPSSSPIAPPVMPPRPPMGPGTAPPMMNAGMRPQVAKRGGKIYGKEIGNYEAGAGSGIGREEKVKNYKKSVKKG